MNRPPAETTPARGLTVTPLVPAEDAEELYEHAPCGYMSCLPDGTIIRINRTLLGWLGHQREDLVGRRTLTDLLTMPGKIYHETHYAPQLRLTGVVQEVALDMRRADGQRLPVLLNSVLARTDAGTEVVRTSVFDATSRQRYERELREALARAERSEAHVRELATTLQSSLLPPALPSLGVLDLGAAYRASGDGTQVGGDFYDVFEAAKDDLAITIGDVCGKGAQAAAITGLARHTMRASAIRVRRPSTILTDLNTALLKSSSRLFCTCVFMRVRLDRIDIAPAVLVTLANGGHPPPLVVSPDGVRPLEAPGTLLGVLDPIDLVDLTITLEPGEGLFCYTDGLMEARRGDAFLGQEGLLEIVDRHRHLDAQSLVSAVVEEVVSYQDGQPRDDIAVLHLRVPPGGRVPTTRPG